jgi:hypothetical protein
MRPDGQSGDVLTRGAHNSLTIDAVAEPRQPVDIYGYQRCPSVLLRSLDVSDLRSENQTSLAGRHEVTRVSIFAVHLVMYKRDRTTRYQRDD